MIFVPGAERRMRASMASQTLGLLRIAAVKSLVLRRWRYSTMSPVSTPMFQTKDWYRASVPMTVLAVQVAAGEFPEDAAHLALQIKRAKHVAAGAVKESRYGRQNLYHAALPPGAIESLRDEYARDQEWKRQQAAAAEQAKRDGLVQHLRQVSRRAKEGVVYPPVGRGPTPPLNSNKNSNREDNHKKDRRGICRGAAPAGVASSPDLNPMRAAWEEGVE